MKRFRYGIMRKNFDVLPTLYIRWFIGFDGTRKFDLGCSWLCFFIQSNNYGRDGWLHHQQQI